MHQAFTYFPLHVHPLPVLFSVLSYDDAHAHAHDAAALPRLYIKITGPIQSFPSIPASKKLIQNIHIPLLHFIIIHSPSLPPRLPVRPSTFHSPTRLVSSRFPIGLHYFPPSQVRRQAKQASRQSWCTECCGSPIDRRRAAYLGISRPATTHLHTHTHALAFADTRTYPVSTAVTGSYSLFIVCDSIRFDLTYQRRKIRRCCAQRSAASMSSRGATSPNPLWSRTTV